MKIIISFFNSNINIKKLFGLLIVLLPMVGLTLSLNDWNFIKYFFVTSSFFIVYKSSGLSFRYLLIYTLLFLLFFSLFILTCNNKLTFILFSTIFSIIASVFPFFSGKEFKSASYFTYIPLIYLSIELNRSYSNINLIDFIKIIKYLVISITPILLLALIEKNKIESIYFNRNNLIRPEVTAVALSTLLISSIIKVYSIDYGEWMLWSAFSIITVEIEKAHIKFIHRVLGVIIGFLCSSLFCLYLPHNPIYYLLFMILAMLTLVSFHSYPLSFFLRCTFISSALIMAGESGDTAYRVYNVIIGGMIGLFFYRLCHYFYKK